MALFDVSTNLRLPAFLEGVNVDRKVESAGFLAEHRRAIGGVAANDVRAVDVSGMEGAGPVDEMLNLVGPGANAGAPNVPALAPPPPPPPPAPAIDMSRLDAAVERLRMLSDRLASEARSDALELGLMIARKVVEGELAVNADRLISVVKSAVSRVGESRRIVVHLAPEDADVLNGHGQTGHAGAKDSTEGGAAPVAAPSPIERLGRGAAKIEVVADPSLSRGDCVVEGDHLSVDARLDAKFAEIRRALMESAWEESA
jgi:hypothetical protein